MLLPQNLQLLLLPLKIPKQSDKILEYLYHHLLQRRECFLGAERLIDRSARQMNHLVWLQLCHFGVAIAR